MSIVLDGTKGITSPGDYQNGTFTGTYTDGVVIDYSSPLGRVSVGASDGLAFYNGGVATTELMRLDSSGNLLIGTTGSTYSAAGRGVVEINGTSTSIMALKHNGSVGGYLYDSGSDLSLVGATNFPINISANGTGYVNVQTNGSERMRIDSSGNMGLGVTSPADTAGYGGKVLDVSGPIYARQSTDSTKYYSIGMSGGNAYLEANGTGVGMLFYTSDTEKMRIDPQGYLQAHAGSGSLTTPNYHSFRSATSSSTWVMYQRHETGTGTNAYGTKIEYRNVAPNGAGNEFLFCSDMSSTRATIRSNGGLANYQANNANLSDVRTKTNIKLAGSYLDKICAIPVKTFLYKDQTDSELNLGVIAQDVEAVAPELIDNTGFGDTPEDGVPLKAIYQTDLQYALMKAIQELKAEVDALKAAK